MPMPKNEKNDVHFLIVVLGFFWMFFGCFYFELSFKEMGEYWRDIYENGIWPSEVIWNVNWDTLGIAIPYEDGQYKLPHSWIGDAQYRQPLIEFKYSNRNPMETFDTNRSIGLFMPQFSLWIEQGVLLGIQVSLGLVCAYIVYRNIVVPYRNKQQQNNTFATLLAFGFIIPFWLYYPQYIVKTFHIDNKMVRYAIIGVTPSLSLLRTTEALNNGVPELFTKDFISYAIYFVCPNTPVVDKSTGKFKKASLGYKFKIFCIVTLYWLCAGLGFTIADMYPRWTLFIGRGPPYDTYREVWLDPWWVLSTKSTYIGGLWVGMFFYTMAFTGIMGQLTTIMVTGYEVEPLFDNPIWKTRTASEFWGKRWNLMIQRLLKRGVYRPSLTVFEHMIPITEEEKNYNDKDSATTNGKTTTTVATNGSTNGTSNGATNGATNNKNAETKDIITKKKPRTTGRVLFRIGNIKIDKRGLQKGLALLCTFAFSGMYHEWLVYLAILLPTSQSIQNGTVERDTFPYLWGGNLSWFAWQALCILGEVTLFPKSWFSGGMPISFMLLYSYIISINGTFFLNPYVHTTFFRDQLPGYLMVQPLPLPPCN